MSKTDTSTNISSSTSRRAAAAASLLAAASVWSCAADVEDDARGSCTLSCSQPRVGAAEFIVEPLGPESDFSEACFFTQNTNPLEDLPGPFRVRFKIYEVVDAFGGVPQEGAGFKSIQDPLKSRVPRSGVGFEPAILGGAVSVNRTNEEHKNADGSITPYWARGIVTPRSEWCSDSCGIITYEVWPVCVRGGGNDIMASVYVQNATLTKSQKLSVIHTTPGTGP